MKPFVFAVAAVALVASVGAAQETPPATPVTGAPVVVGTAAPVVETTTVAAPQRRGLFGRLRNRGKATTMPATGTTVVTPSTVVTPGTVITPAPTTAPAPMPMPMPGAKTGPSAMTMPAAPNEIVLASGTTGEGMVTANYTAPTKQRRGLFGRLRNR